MKNYKFRKTFTYDGKRYSVYADTEVEAEVKKAMRLRDLEEGKVVLSGNTKLRDWADECIRTYKTGLADITLTKYKYRMKSCVLDYLGDKMLKEIKPMHCQECLNRQQGKSKYQIKQTRQMLQFLFEKARQNKLILENPASDLTEPNGYSNSRRALTERETEVFLKSCEYDNRFNLFLLMFYCGCRPSEAAEVQGRDITVVDGYPLLHIRGTKTKASDRNVPMPFTLYEKVRDVGLFEYVVTNKNGNKLDQKARQRAWDSLKRQMNIEMGCKVVRNQLIAPFPLADDLVPYCLRHTYCTNLQKQGVDLRTAQYLMGHSDVKMTANIYTHTDMSSVMEAAKKIVSGSKG